MQNVSKSSSRNGAIAAHVAAAWQPKNKRQRPTLLRVGLAASTALTPAPQARDTLDEIIAIFSAERAFFFCCDSHGDLRLHVGRNAAGQNLDAVAGANLDIARRVQRSGEPRIDCGSDNGAALDDDRPLAATTLHSLMAVPVFWHGALVGIATLATPLTHGVFTETDVQVLQALANPVPATQEAARSAQLEIYKKLAASLPGVVFTLVRDATGDDAFTYLSPGCEALFGVPAGALCGALSAFLERVEAPRHAEFRRSLADSAMRLSPWTWEGRIETGHTKGVWVQSTARPLARADGSIEWVGLFLDVSERKRTEAGLELALADLAELGARERLRAEALIEARERLLDTNKQLVANQAKVVQLEKASSLGRLATGLAHEINNPLAGVMYMFEALQHGQLSAAQQREYTAMINAGLLRIQNTVSSLLQYAQPRTPDLAMVDLADVVAQALGAARPALETRQVALVNGLASGRTAVHADPIQLAQALVNVLLNAAQASPVQSAIEIGVERRVGRVGLWVADHGAGIPPEYVHRVCDPFFTTKRQGEGTGLGLATAQRIVDAHGGELSIESREGRGTRVTLWLPTSLARAG